MTQGGGGGGAIVGRIVTTADAAVTAAADGANLILISVRYLKDAVLRQPLRKMLDLLQGAGGLPAPADVLEGARSRQRSGNPIPVIQVGAGEGRTGIGNWDY